MRRAAGRSAYLSEGVHHEKNRSASRRCHALPDHRSLRRSRRRSRRRRRGPPRVCAAEDAPKGTVWVVNRDLGELAIFDAGTGNLLKTLAVGRGAHDICISEQTGKAYITAETDNMVTVVDTDTLARHSIPVGPLPHHIEPSNDGHTIYVSLASHTPAVGARSICGHRHQR